MEEAGSSRGFFGAAARQAATLRTVEHRPWPLPGTRWAQAQTWEGLLFAHWRLPYEEVRRLVPHELELETHAGAAWLGITPFRVTGLRLRGMLPVPRLSTFLEINVRTYVSFEDKPGVYFFSLDAGSAIAVEGARRLFKLPYFRATISARRVDSGVEYSSARREGPARPVAFRARYWPVLEPFTAEVGSLEYFLTERYCLYTLDERLRVCRAEIHHPPWPLQAAAAEIEENSMPPPGLALTGEGPLLHFSRRQDVVIWPLAPVRGPGVRPSAGSPVAA
jgi:uncharacterized protein YqjF (DUF2071 family)